MKCFCTPAMTVLRPHRLFEIVSQKIELKQDGGPYSVNL